MMFDRIPWEPPIDGDQLRRAQFQLPNGLWVWVSSYLDGSYSVWVFTREKSPWDSRIGAWDHVEMLVAQCVLHAAFKGDLGGNDAVG